MWYLLHFQYFDGRVHRTVLVEKLDRLMRERCGRGYRKNDPQVYELLLAHQPTALRHAMRLAQSHAGKLPAAAEPCTQVHRLVEALNAEIR